MATIRITDVTQLRFDDGTAVRAASAVAPLGQGWLVVQDDVTFAAWWQGDAVTPVRIFDPVEGHDEFSSDEGTKDLKPDLEAACSVPMADQDGVLLLGSGSLAARRRAALVSADPAGGCVVVPGSLDALYDRLAQALEMDPEDMNMEGACVVDGQLRWFQRGNGAKAVQSASVDLALDALVEAVHGDRDPAEVALGAVRRYDLGTAQGVPLAITDAAVLPDGRILVSAAAEDAPDAVADGPIVGAALAVLDGAEVVTVAEFPLAPDGSAWKVEGVAVRSGGGGRFDVLAVVDQDDPGEPSRALTVDLDVT